jgi:hypothetical protein
MKEWEEKEKARLGDKYYWKPFTILVQGEQAEKAMKRPFKRANFGKQRHRCDRVSMLLTYYWLQLIIINRLKTVQSKMNKLRAWSVETKGSPKIQK